MKIFKQLLIILAVNFVGEVLSKGLSLPLPGSIVGMLLLLILLFTGLVKVKHIEETADFLLNNMAFFFIPAGVGIMVSYKYLSGNFVQSVLVILLSTLLVMTFTALATQLLIKFGKRKDGQDNG